jgi:uncharacterized protein YkwD
MRRYIVGSLFVLLSCTNELENNPDAIWDELITLEVQNRLEAELCHESIEGWSETWSLMEERVLDEVNAYREQGADCHSEGVFSATDSLSMDARIRCSARYHSLWMAENDHFDHSSVGGDLGDDPFERMERTGFAGEPVGENIAQGYESPFQVVAGWMTSDGHCANIMNPYANVIGIGYFHQQPGSFGHLWTQNFGRVANN